MACGGAWEVLIDRAAFEVSKYLSTTKDVFLPNSPTAVWMLTLLDGNSLREIAVERNFNALCGMIGCTTTPPAVLAVCDAQRKELQDDARERSDDSGASGNDEDDEAAEAFRQCEKYRKEQLAASKQAMVVDGSMMSRFCSPDCAMHFAELLDTIPKTLVYSREGVIHAVAGLFPNMQPEVLQRLAGAESSAVSDICERKESSGTEQLPVAATPTCATEPASKHVNLQCLLRDIRMVQAVWSRGTGSMTAVTPRNDIKRKLPMPLMVFDWLGTISTEKTKDIFARLCYENMRKIGGPAVADVAEKSDSLFARCMRSVRESCMLKGESLTKQKTKTEEGESQDLCVDFSLQHQRLAFLARYIFTREMTTSLSRLLMYDFGVMERAWAVWHSTGLLESLNFPSAVPGDFTCGNTSSARLYLGVVLLGATGLFIPAVWEEWLQVGGCFAEVLNALGSTPDDYIACVRALTVE
uniref:Uncharacterized protein TCIL3000_10_1790 n=1 Tax=Trypanosoma congolense (strain IL3000) TaxID=1068625 RepID=G0UVK4_TRYCI|nr:unnamed protein product [Trypanosoma congolense IL3000]